MDASKLAKTIISSRKNLINKTRKDILTAKAALISILLSAVSEDEVGEIQTQLQSLSEAELQLQEAEKSLEQLKQAWRSLL